MGRRVAIVLSVLAIVAGSVPAGMLTPSTAHAQAARNADAELRRTRNELQKIRKEREALQAEMKKLQSNERNISQELRNIERQHNATARALKTLDEELKAMNASIQATTADLVRAEDEVVAKRAILKKRLVDIYKRGKLRDMEVLLSAESFGSLVARYKYLHEIATRDRALLKRVEELRESIRDRRTKLVQLHKELQGNRKEKSTEEKKLATLESQRKRSLVKVQASVRQAQKRERELARAEAQVNSIITKLEAARKSGKSGTTTPSPTRSTITTADYGRLSWPVEGGILYNFGRVKNPNQTTIRWNGIGIEAPVGTAVKAVSDGVVRAAESIGLYGRTVIVDHGGGDYSVYASLARINVKVGTKIKKGQTIGTVGQADPDQPPHLHFEIRHNGPAIDPTTWLRNAK